MNYFVTFSRVTLVLIPQALTVIIAANHSLAIFTVLLKQKKIRLVVIHSFFIFFLFFFFWVHPNFNEEKLKERLLKRLKMVATRLKKFYDTRVKNQYGLIPNTCMLYVMDVPGAAIRDSTSSCHGSCSRMRRK